MEQIVKKMFKIKEKIGKQLQRIEEQNKIFEKNKFDSNINSIFRNKLTNEIRANLIDFDFQCITKWKNMFR